MTGRPVRATWSQALALAGLLVLVVGGIGLAIATGPTTPTPAPLPPASLPPEAQADVYVDPRGDDAASGRSDAPLATVERALERAAPGATIWLLPGEHRAFTIGASGARPITIAAGREGRASVLGGDADAAITIAGTSGVTLLDLDVVGPAGAGRAGVRVERSSAVRIDGLTIEGVRGGIGIEVRYSSGVTIARNDVAHSAVAVRLFGEGDPGSVHDVVVESNLLHDSDSMVIDDPAPDNDYGGNGIVWHKVSGPTVARDNQLWNNRAASHDYGTDGGAFEVWGSSNVEITGNTAWDNVNVLETGTDGPPCAGLSFVRNTAFTSSRGVGLILRCAEGGLVAQNVLVGLRGYAFELSDAGGGNRFASSIDGLRILNNIVANVQPYAIRNDLEGRVVADRNVLWNPGGSLATLPGRARARSLSALTETTGFDAGSVAADPRFVDASKRDYRLLPGSPAIDLGAVIDEAPFEGAAPDAGRYELTEASPGPT